MLVGQLDVGQRFTQPQLGPRIGRVERQGDMGTTVQWEGLVERTVNDSRTGKVTTFSAPRAKEIISNASEVEILT